MISSEVISTADDETTISDLKNEIMGFCRERDWDQFHNQKDLAIGMVTEASELLERFRFKTSEQIDEMMSGPGREEIEDELSDTLYFVIRFAQMNDIDLSDSLRRKLIKNAEKYPVSKVRGCNKKYDEYRRGAFASVCSQTAPPTMFRPVWRGCSSEKTFFPSSDAIPPTKSSILHFIRYAVEADTPHLSADPLTLVPQT